MLFQRNKNKHFFDAIQNHTGFYESLEIINKDSIIIPKQINFEIIDRVCMLDIKYNGNNFPILIDCQWEIKYVITTILNSQLGLNIKNNDVFNKFTYELSDYGAINNKICFVNCKSIEPFFITTNEDSK